MSLEKQSGKDVNSINYDKKFYRLVFEYLGEEIFVANGEGKILYVNPASVKTIGLPSEQIIGRNVQDLHSEGYLSVSSTMEVIKKRKTVNVLQKMKDGRIVLATGVPIFYKDSDKILMIVSTSKDVDAINDLYRRAENQAKVIERNIEEINHLRESMFSAAGFISNDPIMEEIKNTIARIAPLDVSVLIQGETGVGKEVVARSLHRLSERKNTPLVKINCGSIPEQLIESELFGYEKGAFTGAAKEGKKGKVEMAHMGTLFLDEIGEMPLNLQVKLLDFLQDGTFVRVGGVVRHKVDVRVIAATNRDLNKMCQEGTFRKDLFYRMNVIPMYIPPLRERKNDIAVLAKYFVSCFNAKYHCYKYLEDGFVDQLHLYDWPGNVREMENIMERVYIMSDGDIVGKNELKQIITGLGDGAAEASGILNVGIMPLKEAKLALEKQLVSKAYEMYHSTYKVAEALQVDQSTVVKLLQKHRCRDMKLG